MKTSSISYKVADGLFLVDHAILGQTTAAKPVEVPTNHVAIIDCSGSMSCDLPKIREQLKRKVPKLLGDKDTLSIIWFSGKGQFGVLLEAEPVSTLTDLQQVNQAIDRWLRPVCLTGFKEPLEEAAKLIDRVSKKRPGSSFSLFFMSDGCDNQWGKAEILKACEKTAGGLSAATFVEYGYYADRPLLTAMAEKAGGALIFSEDFDRYAPQFESAMQKRPLGAKRVDVPIDGDPVGGFAFCADASGDLMTFSVEGGKISVPEGTRQVSYLSPRGIGVVSKEALAEISKDEAATWQSGVKVDCANLRNAYAAVSLFAIRMKPEVVLPLLKSIGDVAFIDQFNSCFGKQKYSEFMEAAKNASTDGAKRWTKGWDPNKVPRDDAFTVLDLLRLLSEDDGNRVLMEHPEFKYSAIGRGRVDASDQLTAEEQAEIESLTAQIAAAKKNAKKVAELTSKIAAITANKPAALKFEADPAPDGYSISNLTFNEDRPNVSILVRKPGTVDVSSRLPADLKGKVPDKVPTSIFRNYAIVKDGLVNVKKLPVKVAPATFDKIVASGAPYTLGSNPFEMVIDVGALPVINRQMIKSVSASQFFCTEYDLTKAQAAQKVFNAFSKELLPPKKAEGIAALYGDAAATWLKEQGITDGGFSPKMVQAEASDFYMGKELKVSLKGLSSLPSLKDYRAGKGGAGAKLMKPFYEKVDGFLKSDVYTKAADKDAVLKAWLEGETKAAKTAARSLIYKVAQTTFCIIVGQIWFSEFASLDENSMAIDTDEGRVECKAELREVQIKI